MNEQYLVVDDAAPSILVQKVRELIEKVTNRKGASR